MTLQKKWPLVNSVDLERPVEQLVEQMTVIVNLRLSNGSWARRAFWTPPTRWSGVLGAVV